ncbi:hypothetical protein FLONG3_145 [Fusarium longipes]|uniref:Heterokaryon incompatibility domain-containing protein n=1 Tax=Fusarium longipes TaxID=694270 RepID=A0A395TAK2_9HYPO|nr:hypothetical protein FLONG3_145 [Fusarium longipes]
MALCGPCYDLIRVCQQHTDLGHRHPYTSAYKFRDWLAGQDDGDSMKEALPRLPGLIHSSWKSFCDSLDNYCPFCWIVWSHIRDSPTALYHNENRLVFNVWLDRHNPLRGGGILWLKCSAEIKDYKFVKLMFQRTTKQQFEEKLARTPVEQHMGSETTVKTVKGWISACDRSGDDGCVAKRRSVMNSLVIPTRLIDVHGCNSQAWSLVETTKHQDFSKYVALSHRWTADTPRLLRDNYVATQAGRPDSAVPRKYQDVFVLCRKLDIRYVWIDSLCILQDSADDFLREAASMTEVYANAFCTFTICWESPDGFLRPRNIRAISRMDSITQDPRALSDRYVSVIDEGELRAAIGNAPVNQRGWVLQEQLLSSRILYLGNDEIYWDCDHGFFSETEPLSWITILDDYRRGKIVVNERHKLLTWRDLVVQFMTLGLSFERDRLLAISGIARFLFSLAEKSLPEGGDNSHRKLGQNVEYFAGLQRAHWIEDLLWCPDLEGPVRTKYQSGEHREHSSGSFKRCVDDIVPSWSWAACPGPIRWTAYDGDFRGGKPIGEMPQLKGGPLACLRKINFNPLGSDVYGLPKSASLDISCLLIRAEYEELDGPEDALKWLDDYGKDRVIDGLFTFHTDSFLLPLPYPRVHSDERSVVTVPVVPPCENFTGTCFIMPLLRTKYRDDVQIMGLVVQERPRADSEAREFVRIGSFTKSRDIGIWAEAENDRAHMGVVNALLKHLPNDGDEFEQKLRECARVWKEKEKIGDGVRDGIMVKAEWTTIRLV